MPNRTISLDDESDRIRLNLVAKGVNFSQWVRLMLLQKGQEFEWITESEVEVIEVKPAPPRNYMCKHCLGDHWTADCPTLEVSE